MSRLVIVESPNKCKKIQQYLGQGWVVRASLGHVRDLPDKEMGVDLQTFQPSYVVTSRAKKTIADLRQFVKSADQVYLATDPDREGEAIAWHLAKVLNLKNFKRATFNQITQKAVQSAIQSAGDLDHRMVSAQECRRVLDRLVGYSVSPALSKAYGSWLTAGRVQSVAVRLVVEREWAIRAFTPIHYVDVMLSFNTDGITWSAKWVPGELLDKSTPYWTDKLFAERVASLRDVIVRTVSKERATRRPPSPFITSTLQQAASVSLKLPPKQSMKLAQHLFEEGLITYHRTDSPNLSEDGVNDVVSWLKANGFADQVADKPNTWKAREGAQEGHEAIRPTSINQTPALLEKTLARNEWHLYRLIWERTVASQMKNAVYNVTRVDLLSQHALDGKRMQFVAQGRELVSAGWLSLTQRDSTEEARESDDDESQVLPPLTENMQLSAEDGEVLDKTTKPPARYTEASLIKKMEAEGIGRPSTYAAILDNIITRNYIAVDKRKLHATELGIQIIEALKNRFAFMEYSYTRDIEHQLDAIATGKAQYQTVLKNAYAQLHGEVEAMDGVRIAGQNDTQHACPQCGQPLRLVQGKFWGCTAYPECRYMIPKEDGKSGTQKSQGSRNSISKNTIDKTHPCQCGNGFLQRRKYQDRYFWGCSDYPSCKQTQPDDKGKPGQRTESKKASLPRVGHSCPQCETGKLVKRAMSKGKNEGKSFIGCTSFPECRYFSWVKD